MATEREIELIRAGMTAGITSRQELANFMAQVTHESGGLTRMEESFRYTRGIEQIPVRSAWREGAEALESARVQALGGQPERLAELMYGGRMGNAEPADGYKFRGRGYMQLTGRDNYRAAGEALGLDLVSNPDLAATPDNAARIAVWYWTENVSQADRIDVNAATRTINGGPNGLADRIERYDEWYETLTPEFVQAISEGRVVLSDAPIPHARTSSVTGNTLRQGENGAVVRDLQHQLDRLGYHDNEGNAIQQDGDFGQRTREALQSFQQAQGLQPDGIVGPRTLEALRKAEQAPLLSSSIHPEHALYRQALAGIEQLPLGSFKNDDERQNAAASLAFDARVSGLHRIDHVVLSANGSSLFAVQGRMDDPAHRRVHVDREQAAAQSIQRSTQQMDQKRQSPVRFDQLQSDRHDQLREPRVVMV